MKNLLRKFISFSIIGVLNILVLVNISYASSNLHLEGRDRFETNMKIVDEAVRLGANTETVVVAAGYSFPDALSAGNLTYKYNYPLILEDARLEQKVARYNPTNVIVVGGQNTVVKNRSLEQRLRARYNFTRLSGTNRYRTSDEVIKYIENRNNQIYYGDVGVRGNDFPDALSAVPFAIKHGSLVRLSDNAANNFDITVGGGVLGNTKRNVSGRDRYVTSQKVVEEFNTDKLIVVKGNDYPDALAASTLAGVLRANILLVNTNGLTNEDIRLINTAEEVIYVGGGVPIYNGGGTTPTDPTEPEEPDNPTNPTQPEDLEPEVPTGPTEADYERMNKKMFRLVNEVRAEKGLYLLEWTDALNDAAQIRAEEASEYPGHIRPDGSRWVTVFEGTGLLPAGENLAASHTPEEAMDSLMGSAGHKSNILTETATKINIGSHIRPDGYIEFVQLFAY
ncbi:cell wall-binding repeat-containing protein [Miniphocaeibacter halophilus]|uniref:Cell wall-binding repeat-containing protein n=1 Tax=Miniphocaeibacter halophilus TaxID=2931922 RepID=A0AC61MPP7_9FIRM|nr:cell wall-binding repeat-containing protein [Miniphocaeibacter halophilus]QQK07397.1 cell wall-binding repeat-containing protein [Miniphocaeibacter halophilus]